MKIALLGMGTVGGGVFETLRSHESGVSIKRVLERRELETIRTMRTENIEDILNDGEIETVVETMGGVKPAFDFVLASLKAKKHVVSSNKQLISEHFRELHEAAAENGVELRYTAAAGGGIPWLFNLARARRCDEIISIEGIINGTCNYILTAMHERGTAFGEALQEAQRLGYAEADPSADIDALDTRRKCAISASIAFDGIVNEAEIPCAGIRGINLSDIAYCKENSLVCKLMFRAAMKEASLCAGVMPVFVKNDSVTAMIGGCGNIVTLEGKALGALSLIGQGAGGAPTGVAVVQDILDIAAGVHKHMPAMRPLSLSSGNDKQSYYIRKGEKQYIKEASLDSVLKEGADFFAQIAK